MVIMEKVGDANSFDTVTVTETIQRQVISAVKKLHEGKFVHGDLRGPNVLVREATNEVWIIDFDWCGTADEACYPYFINHNDLKWPNGVSEGQVMKMYHDEEMVGMMFSSFLKETIEGSRGRRRRRRRRRSRGRNENASIQCHGE